MEILKGFVFDLQRHDNATYLYSNALETAPATIDLTDVTQTSAPTLTNQQVAIRVTVEDGKITEIEKGALDNQQQVAWEKNDIDVTVLGNIKNINDGDRIYKLKLENADGVTVDSVKTDESFKLSEEGKTLTVGEKVYTAKTAATFKGITNEAVLTDGTLDADATKSIYAVAVSADGTNLTQTITLSKGTAVIGTTSMTDLSIGGEVAAPTDTYTISTVNLKYTAVKQGASGTESQESVKVGDVTYKSGDTTGKTGLTIVKDGTDQYVSEGTVYLKDGDSADVKAGNDGTKLTAKAISGDITVTVSGSGITVGDADDDESFTIGDTTYVVKGGKLLVGGAEKEVTALKSGEAFTLTLDKTGAYQSAKAEDNINQTGTAARAWDVTGITFTVSGGGLKEATTVSAFVNNDYLHKDGTVGTSSTDAVGQFKYNSTTGVITYTPTDKTKAQTIDFSKDESEKYKFNVSGTNAADDIKGSKGAHTINGGSGNDTITAGDGNIIAGGAGNDSIIGGENGSLNGGAGNDTLRGAATDTLIGGDGADTFVLNDGKTGAGFISDYKLDQNDVIFVGSKANQGELRELATTTFGAAGTVSLGEDNAVTLDGSKGYYAVNLKAADGKTQLFGWAGEKATKIDASSFKDDVILIGNNNGEADTLFGGSGNDTIHAGAGDVVYGAAGKNVINLHGNASDDAVNTVGVGKGKDTINNFVTGFDSEKADKITIVGGLSSIGSTLTSGNNLEVKSGDAAVTIVGADSNNDGVVEVLVNGKKAVFAADGATVKASSATYADYYLGTKGTNGGSILDASAIEESVSIDLSNTNVFRNFNQVTGGKGKTTLIGSNGNDTLTAGEGATSLYGGAGKDSLVGSSSTEVRDTFFMMAGAGSDTIANFTVFNGENVDTADIVNFSAIQSAKHVTGGAQINVNDTDKVLIENVNVDDAIGYQVGNSINAAKLGDVSNENNFTYLNGVNYYGGGNKVDTLAFTSGDSDNHEIWLDGRKGVSYASVDVVDGSNASGDLILAGDSAKNTIIGGAGSSSLWGGAGNTADVLTGNGSKNTFFYGLAEGNDTITCGSENDLVNLYNIGLSDVSKAEITDSGVSLEFIDGSKVSVDTGYRDVKFALKDGSTWTANHNTHQWNS